MTEIEDPLYSSYVSNCVLNAFSSYSAIMLNSLTIQALRRTSSLPKPLRILLQSLAVSDLGVGLLAQPLYIAVLFKWINDVEDNLLDNIFDVITSLFYYASFLGLMALSLDRFLSVHLHLRYQELVTHKRVAGLVISVWLLSTFLSLSLLWLPSDFVIDLLEITIFGFCFVCVSLFYFRIYRTVRRLEIQMQALHLGQAFQNQNDEMKNFLRLKKSAISSFYIYVVFMICYLPDYCSAILNVLQSQPNLFLDGFDLFTFTLVFANSSFNPVIYCWRVKHIRHSIVGILRNIYRNVFGVHDHS